VLARGHQVEQAHVGVGGATDHERLADGELALFVDLSAADDSHHDGHGALSEEVNMTDP
jgi:hypothetical protein